MEFLAGHYSTTHQLGSQHLQELHTILSPLWEQTAIQLALFRGARHTFRRINGT
jgi:hypothetical protein